ncbi:SIR2 family NAD-dependent protein deacylase [Photobacterium leiognathi]|uniref:SIR2 family NAD-dependent protein deacylase n=1 Tax=Photobacterium leiognathi TaxID=553611 RepID=UPI00298103F0|nr:SIR2 family protein [Photobacterium leiognathi]
MSCIEQLSDEAKESLLSALFIDNYFLWVGSGFSYNYGYGSWEAVLIRISEKLEYPRVLDVSNPLKAAELLASFAKSNKDLSEYDFNSIVAESLLELKKEDVTPSWTRRFSRFSPNMIVTTNWDNQLEEIFDGLANVVIRKDKCPKVSQNGRNIFKIHGDVGRPDSIVVTQSQYFSFQREDTYLNRKIYTLFSEASPIFIGYSLTDPNIGFIYEEVYAHLGEEKPPAFMVVHPSVSDTVFEESKLLFQDKNIHIIKADIGIFLKDLSKELTEFKKGAKSYFLEYANIEDRLKDLFSRIINKNKITKKFVLDKFNNEESRHQAVLAIVNVLSKQHLYKEFGGELLTPENRMSYREIDQVISSVIWMTNENGYPDPVVQESFYGSVMDLCADSDGVWDFYTAREPFKNILRISPEKKSKVFNTRIHHIIEVLRWSAPNQLGKCWATWDEFCKRINWINEIDIDGIIEEFKSQESFTYRDSDRRWLLKLKDCENSKKDQHAKIDKLIET